MASVTRCERLRAPEPAHRVADVGLDGRGGDRERLADLAAGGAARHERHDLALALAQRLPVAVAALGDEDREVAAGGDVGDRDVGHVARADGARDRERADQHARLAEAAPGLARPGPAGVPVTLLDRASR